MLTKRLAALEAARAEMSVRLSPGERQEAARLYEATLYEPAQLNPRAVAYWSNVSAQQIAADYDAMLKGAQAPWL